MAQAFRLSSWRRPRPQLQPGLLREWIADDSGTIARIGPGRPADGKRDCVLLSEATAADAAASVERLRQPSGLGRAARPYHLLLAWPRPISGLAC